MDFKILFVKAVYLFTNRKWEFITYITILTIFIDTKNNKYCCEHKYLVNIRTKSFYLLKFSK